MNETELTVPIGFRLCREEDLRALEWMGLYTHHREIIEEAFAAQGRGEALMFHAVAGGFPVGQAWISFTGHGSPERPFIWAVRIFPALQGAGLGSRLMTEAERWIAARGAQEAELGVEWSNVRARRFYERLGYRPVGERRDLIDYSFEGYPMQMDLDQQIVRKTLGGTAALSC